MYTRILDSTQLTASLAVINLLLYWSIQDIGLLSIHLIRLDRKAGRCTLMSERRVINRLMKKLIQHLKQLQLAEDFGGALQLGLALQIVPQVFANQADHPDDLAHGHALLGARGADLEIALLDVRLGL